MEHVLALPDTPRERGGLKDAWLALHPAEPGFTSPYREDLSVEHATLGERIDHVLYRGPITPWAVGVVGTATSERVCGVGRLGAYECLWPSDHAGLWARFRLAEGAGVAGR